MASIVEYEVQVTEVSHEYIVYTVRAASEEEAISAVYQYREDEVQVPEITSVYSTSEFQGTDDITVIGITTHSS
jgi:hypothetical protein